jgi:uncharacterized lipoprotein YddW (UPF0748 family)
VTRRLVFALVVVLLVVAVPTGAALLRGAALGEPEPRAELGDAPAAGGGDCAGRPLAADRQLRGMWITTVNNIDWPSKRGLPTEAVKAEYRSWLDLAQKLNHNAVFVHVRPSGDALWPSRYAPWSEWLTGHRDGKDPGWDPLAWMITETRARNLEFHAWFNPYRASQPQTVGGAGTDFAQLAPNHPLLTHRDWAIAYPKGSPSGRLYYDPGIPQARRFVEDSILEAVERYDVDGVHFDDFFYPYPEGGDFDDAASFARHRGGFGDKGNWRRNNVDLFVSEMSHRIKALKPWVKFGISPFGIWRNQTADPLGSDTAGSQSYDIISADTRKWVKEEWIDYIVPQIYWSIGFTVADYAKLIPWWSDVVEGTRVQLYIGEADYKIAANFDTNWNDPREMTDHLAFAKDYNVSGHVHFSAVQVRANKLGATDIYAAEHYSKPALVPTMTHLPRKPLLFPVVTGAQRDASGAVTLRWRQSADGVGPFGKATSYAVYRVDGTRLPSACDLADATHLLGTTRGTSFVDSTAAAGKRYTYVVSTLDRLWNESPASPPRFVF